MSIDNTYLIGRINTLQLSIENLAIALNDTVNTHGRVSSILEHVSKEVLELKGNYLATLLNIPLGKSCNRSVNTFISSFTSNFNEGLSKNPQIRTLISNTILVNEEQRSTVKVDLTRSNNVILSKNVNGEILSMSGPLGDFLTEYQLSSIYDKLLCLDFRKVLTELSNTFKMFTVNVNYGITNKQFLSVLPESLNHRYSIDYCKPHVTISIGEIRTLTHSISQLSNMSIYNLDIPFWSFHGLLEDVKWFSENVETILALEEKKEGV